MVANLGQRLASRVLLRYTINGYSVFKKETADYSAITTWGVFYPNEDSKPNLILLDAVKDRFEFPELRRVALDQYKYWNPDMVIIEQKASGTPLTHELRQMDIPVMTFTPSRGNDKHCLLYTSPSPRDGLLSRMPSSA